MEWMLPNGAELSGVFVMKEREVAEALDEHSRRCPGPPVTGSDSFEGRSQRQQVRLSTGVDGSPVGIVVTHDNWRVAGESRSGDAALPSETPPGWVSVAAAGINLCFCDAEQVEALAEVLEWLDEVATTPDGEIRWPEGDLGPVRPADYPYPLVPISDPSELAEADAFPSAALADYLNWSCPNVGPRTGWSVERLADATWSRVERYVDGAPRDVHECVDGPMAMVLFPHDSEVRPRRTEFGCGVLYSVMVGNVNLVVAPWLDGGHGAFGGAGRRIAEVLRLATGQSDAA